MCYGAALENVTGTMPKGVSVSEGVEMAQSAPHNLAGKCAVTSEGLRNVGQDKGQWTIGVCTRTFAIL